MKIPDGLRIDEATMLFQRLYVCPGRSSDPSAPYIGLIYNMVIVGV
jgi:hypothetical protein